LERTSRKLERQEVVFLRGCGARALLPFSPESWFPQDKRSGPEMDSRSIGDAAEREPPKGGKVNDKARKNLAILAYFNKSETDARASAVGSGRSVAF